MDTKTNKLYLFIDYNEVYEDEGLDAYYVEIRDEKDTITEIIKWGANENEVLSFAEQYQNEHTEIDYIVNNI